MSINRNDPCLCGSGKKYKKCCLIKSKVIQFKELQVEKFFQQKHKLVEHINYFLETKLSFQELQRLETIFQQRTGGKIPKERYYPFFRFWLNFFYEFDNKLTGVEWCLQEYATKLSHSEKMLLNEWTKLQLTLVQAIEIKGDTVIFEEMLSKERYEVSISKEVTNEPMPWYGTFGLLELFNSQYFFNGVRLFIGPQQLYQAYKKIVQLMDQTKETKEKVMFEYYPEILAELFLEDEKREFLEKTKEIVEFIVHYSVTNEKEVVNYLASRYDSNPESGREKLFSWINEWHAYYDSELNSPIHLGNIIGTISLEKNKLKFTTLNKDAFTKFRVNIEKNIPFIQLLEIEEITLSVPLHAELKNMVVSMDKNIPAYFSMYAQNGLLLDMHESIPMFDHLSLQQLVEKGRTEEVDMWLKQMEWNLYYNVLQQLGSVEITGDFNTVRKQLQLPLSPFVTGGKERVSSIKLVESNPNVRSVKKEDIPFLEALGFTPETINKFYTNDFLEFFKAKTIGKSDATYKKYKTYLCDLHYLLEQAKVTSWKQCDQPFWESIICVRYMSIFEWVSRTQIKDFLSVIKAFTKYVDDQNQTTIGKVVAKIAKEHEPKLCQSVSIIRK